MIWILWKLIFCPGCISKVLSIHLNTIASSKLTRRKTIVSSAYCRLAIKKFFDAFNTSSNFSFLACLIILCSPSATMVNNNGHRMSPYCSPHLHLISLLYCPLTMMFVAMWSHCHIHICHLGPKPLTLQTFYETFPIHSIEDLLNLQYRRPSQSGICILPLFFYLFDELFSGQWLHHSECSCL